MNINTPKLVMFTPAKTRKGSANCARPARITLMIAFYLNTEYAIANKRFNNAKKTACKKKENMSTPAKRKIRKMITLFLDQ